MAKITAQGVNAVFSRDLSRNRQYLLGEEVRRYLFASRRAGDPRCCRGAFKSSESVIRSRLRYYMRISCFIYMVHIYIYIKHVCMCVYIHTHSIARERGKERDVPTVYVCIYVYGEDTARLFAQPRKQYIDV